MDLEPKAKDLDRPDLDFWISQCISCLDIGVQFGGQGLRWNVFFDLLRNLNPTCYLFSLLCICLVHYFLAAPGHRSNLQQAGQMLMSYLGTFFRLKLMSCRFRDVMSPLIPSEQKGVWNQSQFYSDSFCIACRCYLSPTCTLSSGGLSKALTVCHVFCWKLQVPFWEPAARFDLTFSLQVMLLLHMYPLQKCLA